MLKKRNPGSPCGTFAQALLSHSLNKTKAPFIFLVSLFNFCKTQHKAVTKTAPQFQALSPSQGNSSTLHYHYYFPKLSYFLAGKCIKQPCAVLSFQWFYLVIQLCSMNNLLLRTLIYERLRIGTIFMFSACWGPKTKSPCVQDWALLYIEG